MIRRMFILGALALVVFAPAAHAQYNPGTPGASVSDSSVSSGDTVTVTATGCEVGSTVTFFLDGDNVLGSGVTDDSGTASADVVINASDGTHTISNSCNDAVISITVGSGAVAGALPRTGSDSSLPLAKVATVLIAAGGLLILAARSRKTVTA